MTKKQVRNPRIFVDTPADLKADYAAVCKIHGTTMSQALKAYMRDVVRMETEPDYPLDEQKEPA